MREIDNVTTKVVSRLKVKIGTAPPQRLLEIAAAVLGEEDSGLLESLKDSIEFEDFKKEQRNGD